MTTDLDLRSKLQLYLINTFRGLPNSLTNIHKLLKIIEYYTNTNNNITKREEDADLCEFQSLFGDFSRASISYEFTHSFYSLCLNEILTNLNPNLANTITTTTTSFNSLKELLLRVISTSSGNYSNSFCLIYDLCLSLRYTVVDLLGILLSPYFF